MLYCLLQTVLNEVIQYRNQNANNFLPSESTKSLDIEYLPWTVANGEEGVADALLQQVSDKINTNCYIQLQGLSRKFY